MKKNKLIITIISIILISILGYLYLNDIKNNKLKENENISVENIVENVISHDIDNFEMEDILKAKNYALKMEDGPLNNDSLCKVNFILGYISYIDKNNDEAIRRYNEAIKCFDINTESKIKVSIYYELSKVYTLEKEHEKSAEYFNKATDICDQENLSEDKVKISIYRSLDIYDTKEGKLESLKLIKNTLNIAEDINYSEIEDVYFNLGILYWYDNRQVEAINYKIKALDIAREKHLKTKVLNISTDIGIDYLFLENYRESIKYFENIISYEIDDIYENSKVKAYAILNLVDAYIKINEYDNARKYLNVLEESIENLKSEKDDYKTCMYASKADLEINLGNIDEALKLLNLVSSRLEISNDFGFFNFDIKVVQLYGDAYYKLENYEEAIKYHKHAENLIYERELLYLKNSNAKKIYLDYKDMNDYENAVVYLEKSNNIQKAFKDNQDIQYSQYLIKKFESDKKLEEIMNMNTTKENIRHLHIGIVIITLSIVGCSINIYRRNKDINRNNALLKNETL